MPHYYCPCGSLIERVGTGRPLKSPCLRLFVSIRTLKSLSPDTKVCNACRAAYYVWKKANTKFENILSRVEHQLSDFYDSTDEEIDNN